MAASNPLQEIWSHPLYQEHYRLLQEQERKRTFCRHTLEHFLDVARLAYIRALEEGLPVSREEIYGAALLHDLGRALQNREGIPHHLAGVSLAEKILTAVSFSPEEKERITAAISAHRNNASADCLSRLLYEADKKSRNCFSCPAEKECYWPDEKKILQSNIEKG